MANAPLSERDGKSHRLICISEKQKYFRKGHWTGQITLIRHDKLDFWRNAACSRGKTQRSPAGQINPWLLPGGSAARCEGSHALKLFPLPGHRGHSSGMPETLVVQRSPDLTGVVTVNVPVKMTSPEHRTG
jgi:hypothetical protein